MSGFGALFCELTVFSSITSYRYDLRPYIYGPVSARIDGDWERRTRRTVRLAALQRSSSGPSRLPQSGKADLFELTSLKPNVQTAFTQRLHCERLGTRRGGGTNYGERYQRSPVLGQQALPHIASVGHHRSCGRDAGRGYRSPGPISRRLYSRHAVGRDRHHSRVAPAETEFHHSQASVPACAMGCPCGAGPECRGGGSPWSKSCADGATCQPPKMGGGHTNGTGIGF